MNHKDIHFRIESLTREIEDIQQQIEKAEESGKDPRTLLRKFQVQINSRFTLYKKLTHRDSEELSSNFKHIGAVIREIMSNAKPV